MEKKIVKPAAASNPNHFPEKAVIFAPVLITSFRAKHEIPFNLICQSDCSTSKRLRETGFLGYLAGIVDKTTNLKAQRFWEKSA
ncbi:MAG: hypothetical protein GWO38_33040 [Phycisphaerae bacterium]|nr:hypothetical protein [Phycisphaerae bacterium]NIX32319.1 hypothetical protein [Phycisphaerae bacterium]